MVYHHYTPFWLGTLDMLTEICVAPLTVLIVRPKNWCLSMECRKSGSENFSSRAVRTSVCVCLCVCVCVRVCGLKVSTHKFVWRDSSAKSIDRAAFTVLFYVYLFVVWGVEKEYPLKSSGDECQKNSHIKAVELKKLMRLELAVQSLQRASCW